MSEMKEVARLQFQYMLVTCEIAQDVSTATIRRVDLPPQAAHAPAVRYERTIDLAASANATHEAYTLFHDACADALSLYTRTEWTDSMIRAGVEI